MFLAFSKSRKSLKITSKSQKPRLGSFNKNCDATSGRTREKEISIFYGLISHKEWNFNNLITMHSCKHQKNEKFLMSLQARRCCSQEVRGEASQIGFNHATFHSSSLNSSFLPLFFVVRLSWEPRLEANGNNFVAFHLKEHRQTWKHGNWILSLLLFME